MLRKTHNPSTSDLHQEVADSQRKTKNIGNDGRSGHKIGTERYTSYFALNKMP
jgi:hypothetical protein